MNQHSYFIIGIIILLVLFSNFNVICSSYYNYIVISFLSLLGFFYAYNIKKIQV